MSSTISGSEVTSQHLNFVFKGVVYTTQVTAPDDLMMHLFHDITEKNQYKLLFSNITIAKCKFFRLKTPVKISDKKGYLNRDNWEQVDQETEVTELTGNSERFHPKLVYLVIELKEDESINAVNRIKAESSDLFSCLNIEVAAFLDWTMDDVRRNLRGGTYSEDGSSTVPNDIMTLQRRLARRRIYQGVENDRDFLNAQQFNGSLFDRIFQAATPPTKPTVGDSREFAVFYNILRCFQQDVNKLVAEKSSALKAGNFTAYFIQPPFFAESEKQFFRYTTDMPWRFPILLRLSESESGAWRKLTPKSDFMLYAPQHHFPFLVSDVISQHNQKDLYRTLIHATALARIGTYLTTAEAKTKFFVVALYLDEDMIASRYIVMQTGSTGGDAVSIIRKDFDLTEEMAAVEFAREMYNLVAELRQISPNLDKDKQKLLSIIKEAVKDIITLRSRTSPAKIPGEEGDGWDEWDECQDEGTEQDDDQDDDDPGIFGAKDIQLILQQMDYRFEHVAFGYPNVAVIRHKHGDRYGLLKFVKTGHEHEVDIIRYLSAFKLPTNHTVQCEFWTVEGGTVISMPPAGRSLTEYKRLNEQLWFVANQLVEAVEFMHEHEVAHMDIKPSNVLITSDGHLSVIDFNSALRISNSRRKYRGVVGTETFIAPEVKRGGAYHPFQADLWSCGRTLEELCVRCRESPNRTFILHLAHRLMNEDPAQRPTMAVVRQLMASRASDDPNVGGNSLE